MTLTQQQAEVAQAALFLIDNIGQPPPDITFREFADQAIAEHLQRHSYYYQQKNLPGLANRILVTSDWMRKYINSHWMRKHVQARAHAGILFYPPHAKPDDFADSLFRKGSTDGFSADILTSYGYDKATFSEADLPSYSEHIQEVDSDATAVEEYGTDSDHKATKRSQEHTAAGSNSQGYTKRTPRATAYVVPSLEGSQKSFRSTEDGVGERYEDGENFDDDDDNDEDEDDDGVEYSDANENIVLPKEQFEMHLPAETSANLLTGVNSATAEEAKQAARQTKGKNQETESPEKRGRGRPKKQAPRQPATPTAATEPIPFSLPSAGNHNNSSQLPSRALGTLDNILSRIKRRKNSDPEDDELKQPPAAPSFVDSGKRKRGSEDLGDPTEDEVAIEPTERKKSKTSIKLDRNFVHPQVIIPGTTPPPNVSSELTFGASPPPAANATYVAENPNGMQPQVEEVKDSQPSSRAASTQDTEQQPKLAPFDSGEQGRDFENFYIMIERATDRVIKSIGDIGNSVSFLDESPSERLQALYTRCWGSDWRAFRVRLTKEQVFTTPDAAMSMISAFLLDNVLNQQASIQEIQAKQLELKGTMGRAILRTLALEGGEEELAKVARTIESEDARIKLIEGEKSGTLQHELHAEAKQFTRKLWDIIAPHFRSLSRLARGYGLSSHHPERDWRDVFETVFTKLIESILHFRLKLLATGCEHVYTWPDAAQEYDLREMDFHGAQMKLPVQVMFTVFPGVKVRPHGSANMRAYKGMKAMTKVEMPRAA